MLKFFYNGIKGSDGKLQKANYSDGMLLDHPKGTITIYCDGYRGFSDEVAAEFKIENNSDSMTDYFEEDKIRVHPDHPLYSQVLEALGKQAAKREKRWAKYQAKHA